MKRLLIFILALALLLNASGQILRYSNYTLAEPPTPPPDFYDEYDPVYAAFTTKPNSTIADYQEALVYSLDTMDFAGGASVWDRMDVFEVYATHTNGGGEALINWANPGTDDADDPTTVQWDNLQGYTGDGTTDYISTNYVPSTDATNYAQNSAAVGIYLRINQAVDEERVWGTYTADANCYLRVRTSADEGYHIINSGGGDSFANTNSSGLWITTRTGATAYATYLNGSLADAGTDASAGVSSQEFTVLSYTTYFSSNQVAVFFIMNAVTAAEAAAINTVIETYMDAIGTGVQ